MTAAQKEFLRRELKKLPTSDARSYPSGWRPEWAPATALSPAGEGVGNIDAPIPDFLRRDGAARKSEDHIGIPSCAADEITVGVAIGATVNDPTEMPADPAGVFIHARGENDEGQLDGAAQHACPPSH